MKLNIPAMITVVAISALAFAATDDIIRTLGLQHGNARDYILKNFIGGFDTTPVGSGEQEDTGAASGLPGASMKTFRTPYLRSLKHIATGDKTALAKELCAYIKQYVNSREFIEDYKALRAKTKPVSEPRRLFSDAQIQKMEADLKASEQALKQTAGHLPKEQQTEMKQHLERMRQDIRRWKDPAPNKTLWEKMYPEDPAVMVKARLQEYLALLATVDFKAATTGTGSNKRFTNPAYEAREPGWKAIYRAGREVNDVAASFVRTWLQGEIIAKQKTSMAQYTDADLTGEH